MTLTEAINFADHGHMPFISDISVHDKIITLKDIYNEDFITKDTKLLAKKGDVLVVVFREDTFIGVAHLHEADFVNGENSFALYKDEFEKV